MQSPHIQFTWADIWLLQSIAIASTSNPASLVDVIAVGDWIEHAIFGYGEIQSGLARLIASRCVHYEPLSGSFSLNNTFADEYARVAGPARDGLLQQRRRLEAHFHVQPASGEYRPDLPDPRWLFPDVSPEEFREVLSAYSYRVRKSPRKSPPAH